MKLETKDFTDIVRNTYLEIGGMRRIRNLSQAAIDFNEYLFKTMKFFESIVSSRVSADYGEYMVKSALKGKEIDVQSDIELAMKDPGSRIIDLGENLQTMLEMFYIRVIENFELYIIEIIKSVLLVKPEILSKTMTDYTIKEILEIDSIDLLVKDTIEKKVHKLSYDGFNKLVRWCGKRGIQIVLPENSREIIADAIISRNVIVHNRGLVDIHYVNKSTNEKYNEGDLRRISVKEFEMVEILIYKIVLLTDKKILGKYEIEKNKFNDSRIDYIKRLIAEGELN